MVCACVCACELARDEAEYLNNKSRLTGCVLNVQAGETITLFLLRHRSFKIGLRESLLQGRFQIEKPENINGKEDGKGP